MHPTYRCDLINQRDCALRWLSYLGAGIYAFDIYAFFGADSVYAFIYAGSSFNTLLDCWFVAGIESASQSKYVSYAAGLRSYFAVCGLSTFIKASHLGARLKTSCDKFS